MKKLLMFAIVVNAFIANAQYKKASFLEKDGRTYELGLTSHIMSKPRSAQQGIHFGLGRETEKRLFSWYDLELLLPSNVKTTGIEYYTKKSEVITGKTKMGFILRYDWGYFLLDNTKDENKILPFITVGLNYKLGGGLKLDAANINQTYEDFYLSEFSGNIGFNGGAGAIFKFTEKIGARLTVGYNKQLSGNIFSSTRGSTSPSVDNTFETFVSHPYVTLAVRFKIIGED